MEFAIDSKKVLRKLKRRTFMQLLDPYLDHISTYRKTFDLGKNLETTIIIDYCMPQNTLDYVGGIRSKKLIPETFWRDLQLRMPALVCEDERISYYSYNTKEKWFDLGILNNQIFIFSKRKPMQNFDFYTSIFAHLMLNSIHVLSNPENSPQSNVNLSYKRPFLGSCMSIKL